MQRRYAPKADQTDFFDRLSASEQRKEANAVKATGFLLTLGLGMAAGGAAVLMLPQQSKVRKTAQKTVDSMEQSISEMLQ